MTVVGRVLGTGKLVAAEVPAERYFAADEQVVALTNAGHELLNMTLGQHKLDYVKLTAIEKLVRQLVAGSAWLRSGSHDQVIALPQLAIDQQQRNRFLEHFHPPKAENLADFDTFFRSRFEQTPDVKDVLTSPGVSQHEHQSFDPIVYWLLQLLQVVHVELRRREAILHETDYVRLQANLWIEYIRFYSEMETVLSGRDTKPIQSEAVSRNYAPLLQACFEACGRRESQSLGWFVRRELVRWRFQADPRRKQMARRIEVLSESEIQSNSQDIDVSSKLFDACILPCEQSGCRAYWDANLLFYRQDLELLSQLLLIAFRHRQPTSFERVVGVSRSGLGFATLISLVADKPLSVLLPDNILNLNPHPAVSERWLLVDDAYQTGYCFQAIRSQMAGFHLPPEGRDLFVLFKGEASDGSKNGSAFNLTKNMEEARRAAGFALQYQHTSSSRYPRMKGPAVQVSKTMGEKMMDRLRSRIMESRRDNSALDRAAHIIAQDRFMKVAMLFDHPSLILRIGYDIYRHTYKTEGPLSFLAGSSKAVPFAVAASLHAMVDGRDAPVITLLDDHGLRYTEVLRQVCGRRAERKVAFIDVVRRTGLHYKRSLDLIEQVNRTLLSNDRLRLDPGVVVAKAPLCDDPGPHRFVINSQW